MLDQSNGLRFDIYERVQLPQDLPGIAELEEVELVPDIRVTQKDSHAELYGQLVLTGLYRGEDDRTQRLEHSIPVEITVPLARVGSIEEIGVEIDNFDIDLLTMRTVNITGVLLLRGVGGASPSPAPAWQQEEYTVAYASPATVSTPRAEPAAAPDEETLYENSLWTFGEGLSEDGEPDREPNGDLDGDGYPGIKTEPEASAEPEAGEPETMERELREKCDSEPALAAADWTGFGGAAPGVPAAAASGSATGAEDGAADRTPLREPPEEAEATAGGSPQESADLDSHGSGGLGAQELAEASGSAASGFAASDSDAWTAIAPEADAAGAIAAAPPAEEKPDLKIALGSKKETSEEANGSLAFSSLLSSSRHIGGPEQQEAGEPQAQSASESPAEAEWKRRFIRGLEGSEPFRKVRLCIVQREETLDSIAEKYRLSVRELSLYNRLSESTVEEGQILYIP